MSNIQIIQKSLNVALGFCRFKKHFPNWYGGKITDINLSILSWFFFSFLWILAGSKSSYVLLQGFCHGWKVKQAFLQAYEKRGIFFRKLWHIAGRAESCRVHLWCRGDLREWRVTEISLGPWVWLWGITHCQHTPQIWKVRMGSAERSGLLVHLKKPIPGTNPCPRPQTFGTQKDLVGLRQRLFWQK